MKIFAHALNLIAWFIIVAVICGWLYLYWEDHQDVMSYIRIKPGTSAVIAEDSIRMAIIGEKKLSCVRVPWSEVGYAIIDGYNTEIFFRWVDDLSPMSSFPKGKLDVGIAEFSGMDTEKTDFVGFTVKHICHDVEKISPIYWIQVNE